MLNAFERAFVWTGGTIFVGSLALTAWTYAIRWSIARPWMGWLAIALDALLITLFAFHHSAFAREPIKGRLASVIPTRLLRSVYVWAASLLLIGVDLAWQTVGGMLYQISGWPAVIFAVVQIVGVWLIARSVRAIDPLELAGIRNPRMTDARRSSAEGSRPRTLDQPSNADAAEEPSQPEPAEERRETLQTDGVYRLVRHPLYFGWVLIVFGAAHMTGDRFAFAVLTTTYLVVAMPWEERSLEREFGSAYRLYKEHVRWRIVPYVY